MTTTWCAPGRVNLIGEHTDYNDGFVLPFALPLGVTARVTRRDDGVLVVTSAAWPGARVERVVADLAPGTTDGWAAYVEGVVWALRAAGHGVDGLDVHLESDLPAGAGLSSSAAVSCAVTCAIADGSGLHLDRDALVSIAHAAEHDYVGVPVGVLDQNAVIRCRAGHALFLDTRSMAARQVRLTLDGLTFLVIDTQAPHRLVDGEYARRRRECRASADLLGVAALRDVALDELDAALARLPDADLRARTRHVVTENARVLETVALLDAGADVRDLGPLLTASHVSLRDDYQVSAPELDLAVDAALRAGAYGARMTGGGFGGSAIALVDADAVQSVREEVERAFAGAGNRPPVVFAAVASDGAHRVGRAEYR